MYIVCSLTVCTMCVCSVFVLCCGCTWCK